jgi:hypothetical protein
MPYVNQIGDAQFPPPYTFPNVEILSFRLPASLDALTRLCNDLLNIGDLDDRGFTFRPMFPFVDLEILHYPKMEYGLFPQFGTISQHECYVRLFVMKYISVGGWLVPDGEVAMYCPFLVVDHPWSAFSGRDVLGFPKLIGSFGPFSPAHPYTTVSTMTFSAGSQQASVLPVVQITQAPQGAPPPPLLQWPWGDIGDNFLNPWRRVLGGSLHFDPMLFASVQMKQFRDAEFPLSACYQAIVQSSVELLASTPPEPLPPVEVTIIDYPGLVSAYRGIDLAASLGIAPNTPITPISQYHLTCTFGFTGGVTLFENSYF